MKFRGPIITALLMLVALSSSCEVSHHSALPQRKISASQEEMASATRGGYVNYDLVLKRAYSGDEEAFKKLIQIRSDSKCLWDGAGSDIFIVNFHSILKVFGDEKAAEIIGSTILASDKDLWKGIVFPSGQDGLPIPQYIKEYPMMYDEISS